MDDVTDTVFRQIVAVAARPDVFFTEFTNVDGLMSKGREMLIRKLEFAEAERPIVAQVWGLKPGNFYEASKQILEMGFDGVDINMGCPQRDVIKAGACAALINNRSLAKEIIKAAKEGAGNLPVAVKTRIGLSQIETESWTGFLLAQGLDSLTVHGRTVSEMSRVPAHWDEIGKAVRIRDSMEVDTLIIGNGDVVDRADGIAKSKEYGVDGVMIGTGIFDDLWAFSRKVSKVDKFDYVKSKVSKVSKALEHVRLFEKTWGAEKNLQILKKFFKIYISGFEGASDFRSGLMNAKSYSEIYAILDRLQK